MITHLNNKTKKSKISQNSIGANESSLATSVVICLKRNKALCGPQEKVWFYLKLVTIALLKTIPFFSYSNGTNKIHITYYIKLTWVVLK